MKCWHKPSRTSFIFHYKWVHFLFTTSMRSTLYWVPIATVTFISGNYNNKKWHSNGYREGIDIPFGITLTQMPFNHVIFIIALWNGICDLSRQQLDWTMCRLHWPLAGICRGNYWQILPSLLKTSYFLCTRCSCYVHFASTELSPIERKQTFPLYVISTVKW